MFEKPRYNLNVCLCMCGYRAAVRTDIKKHDIHIEFKSYKLDIKKKW